MRSLWYLTIFIDERHIRNYFIGLSMHGSYYFSKLDILGEHTTMKIKRVQYRKIGKSLIFLAVM